MVPKGSAIAVDEPVLKVSEDILQSWIVDRELELEASALDLAEVELSSQRNARDLERQIDDRRLESATAESRIRSSLKRDNDRLQVLQIRHDQAVKELQRVRERAEQLRQLAQQGYVPPRELTDAERHIIRQQQQLRTAQEELSVHQGSSGAVARTRAQFDLARSQIDLGANEDGALFLRQRAVELERWQQSRHQRREQERLLQRKQRDETALANPWLTVDQPGWVDYHDDLQLGDRIYSPTKVRLQGSDALEAVVEVLAPQRDLLAAVQNNLRIFADIPAIELSDVPMQLLAIATQGRSPQGEDPRYAVRFAFAEIPAGLQPGMKINLRVDMPDMQTLLRIPVWSLVNELPSQVRMADGGIRDISGRRVGSQFIIHAGLAEGDEILIPDGMAEDRERASGVVSLIDPLEIKGYQRTRIADLVEDGAVVAAGDIVGELVLERKDRNFPEEADIAAKEELAQKNFELQQIRSVAQQTQVRQRVERASLDLRADQYELLVMQYGRDSVGEERAAAAVVLAELDQTTAQDHLAQQQAQFAQGIVSSQAVSAAQARAQRSAIQLRRSQLNEVAARRGTDRVSLWQQRSKIQQREDTFLQAQHDLALERLKQAQNHHRSWHSYQREMDRATKQRRQWEQLTLRAAVDGPVYYAWNRYRPIEIGGRLLTSYPLMQPRSTKRHVRVLVSAHRYGSLEQGDDVQIYIPLLGADPVVGEVSLVERHFHIPESANDDILIAGEVGVPERVFGVVVVLNEEQLAGRHVPPGTSAWMVLPE